MKFIVLFIVLIKFICLINCQEYCETCIGENKKCNKEYDNGNEIIYISAGNCVGGTTCGPAVLNVTEEQDYTCIKQVPVGGACLEKLYICGLGLLCKNNVCQNVEYASVGESCSEDKDCSSDIAKCTEGVCTTTSCDGDDDCSFDNYCKRDSKKCTAAPTEGQSCELSYNLCSGSLICSEKKICVRRASAKLGQLCAQSLECDYTSGLYCSGENICEEYVEPTQTIANCSTAVDSCGMYHACSCSDGKCYENSMIPNSFEEYYIPLIDCMVENKCKYHGNTESSDSCVSSKCGKEYCSYLTKSVGQSDIITCGASNLASEYCERNSSFKLTYSLFSILLILIISLLL